MKRYLVLTLRKPAFDPAAIEPHYAYLDALRARGQLELAGPFTDRTGGAYLMLADSLEDALAIAHTDPVYVTNSSEVIVREWNAK
jgi:uncharacterized protein YciI